MPVHDNPYAAVISAAELASKGDRQGSAILIAETDVPPQHLAEAAIIVFSGVMAGDRAAERFAELRADVHQLAEHVGAGDGQVILCLESIAAVEALTRDDPERARALVDGSTFSLRDITNVVSSFCGQAIRTWMGERAPAFFAALRREYGVDGAA